mgnify:CR=1 FL=1
MLIVGAIALTVFVAAAACTPSPGHICAGSAVAAALGSVSGELGLRKFLEELLQRRYLENVPSIVPLLEKEHRIAGSKLEATVSELNRLDRDHLKEMGVWHNTLYVFLSDNGGPVNINQGAWRRGNQRPRRRTAQAPATTTRSAAAR